MRTHLRAAFFIAVVSLVILVSGALAAGAPQDAVSAVRQATARFHDIEAARAAGYELGYVNGAGNRIITGCIAHPTAGVMGYHYFNQALIDDLTVDPDRPEGLVYTSGADGQLRLVAVEYVVPGPNSNPPGVAQAPTVLGMRMHILVPAVGFYIQHVWVWSHSDPGRAVRGLEPHADLPLAISGQTNWVVGGEPPATSFSPEDRPPGLARSPEARPGTYTD